MSKVPPPSDNGAPDPVRFALVPVSILNDRTLSDAAVRLYAVLDGRVTNKGSQRIRQDTLAAQLGWSRRKVQRAIAELQNAGHIQTRRRSRSSRIVVENTVRQGKPANPDASNLAPETARCVKSGAADASNLAPPQINKSLRNKDNNNGGADPARSRAPESAAAADGYFKTAEYLTEIEAATGYKIAATKTTQRQIAAIRDQRLTPSDTAALVAAYLAAAGDGIRNPAGYIAGQVLPDLAAGQLPETPKPTPTPPTLAEIQAATPCKHGEPRGPSGCALCRHVDMAGAA